MMLSVLIGFFSFQQGVVIEATFEKLAMKLLIDVVFRDGTYMIQQRNKKQEVLCHYKQQRPPPSYRP
jgi:hypothetical protein